MGSEPCGQHWQTSPVSEACSICAFRVDAALATMLATVSMLQTPSAVHFSADPCHVLCCNCAYGWAPVGQATSGFIRTGYLNTLLSYERASLVAECVACFKKMADCQHSCFCNETSPHCDPSRSMRQVDISAQRYLVMPCRPAQSKSTKTTWSTSLPSPTCPILLGNRTSPCTVGCLCPSSCIVAC